MPALPERDPDSLGAHDLLTTGNSTIPRFLLIDGTWRWRAISKSLFMGTAAEERYPESGTIGRIIRDAGGKGVNELTSLNSFIPV